MNQKQAREPVDAVVGMLAGVAAVGLAWWIGVVGVMLLAVAILIGARRLPSAPGWAAGAGYGLIVLLAGAIVAHPHECNDTAAQVDRSFCGGSFDLVLVLIGAAIALASAAAGLRRHRPV